MAGDSCSLGNITGTDSAASTQNSGTGLHKEFHRVRKGRHKGGSLPCVALAVPAAASVGISDDVNLRTTRCGDQRNFTRANMNCL